MNTKVTKVALTLLLSACFTIAFQFRLLAYDQAPAVVFVAGEVVAPGEYRLKEGMTVLQALALAKGTNAKAAVKHTIIFREKSGNEKREEIEVDLEAIMKGQKEDILLLPNDIVVVPNSKLKRTN